MRVSCPECGGSGVLTSFVPEICFYCEGAGVVDEEPDDRPDVPESGSWAEGLEKDFGGRAAGPITRKGSKEFRWVDDDVLDSSDDEQALHPGEVEPPTDH